MNKVGKSCESSEPPVTVFLCVAAWMGSSPVIWCLVKLLECTLSLSPYYWWKAKVTVLNCELWELLGRVRISWINSLHCCRDVTNAFTELGRYGQYNNDLEGGQWWSEHCQRRNGCHSVNNCAPFQWTMYTRHWREKHFQPLYPQRLESSRILKTSIRNDPSKVPLFKFTKDYHGNWITAC